MNRGRGRGRGLGNLQPNTSPASGSGEHPFRPPRRHHYHHHRNPGPRGSSSERKYRTEYVVKSDKRGQSSSEPKTTTISDGVKSLTVSDLAHQEKNTPALSAPNCSTLSFMGEEGTQVAQTPSKVPDDNVKQTLDFANKLNSSCHDTGMSQPSKYGDKDRPSPLKVPKTDDNVKVKPMLDSANKLNISSQDVRMNLPSNYGDKGGHSPLEGPKTLGSDRKPENSEPSSVSGPFDICPPKASSIKLKPSLFIKNRERRNEMNCNMENKVLRPGMVLLKGYLSEDDQVKIVKQCRNLGLGPGGFYKPGYRDGGKLHLNMMCLGKNWDPETSKYGDHRPNDGAKPPKIPAEFYQLVENAIKYSHSLIRGEKEAANAEKLLPWMTPDICLVNFYSADGRLGLHQDRDESPESIKKGLPVVSFSIGDTAEFLYGDQRDLEKAEKIMLESGDVLIFGGASRSVFHGVTTIQTDTASKTLLEETNFRRGRLNLTFRQY